MNSDILDEFQGCQKLIPWNEPSLILLTMFITQ